MKYLICAQPKSASTSLMTSIGRTAGITFGQQFGVDNRRTVRFQRRSLEKLNRPMRTLFGKKFGIRLDHIEKGTLREAFPASEYGIMARFHSDIADFTQGRATKIELVYTLHKQHFPPTSGNIALLRPVPKIVLVRDIEQTLAAYKRVPRNSRNLVLIERVTHDRIFAQKLADEIERWQRGWIEEAKAHGGLILDFQDVVHSPACAMASIFQFLGLDQDLVGPDFMMPKERSYRGR
ncbi:hypothetical protein [Novosphingobium album (ex Liu et al. 2023)]|uniref:Sulfotransferase family protein n=1 Tax=Novosphingobium album (ex Liu et al. 2023) TaxID=3031130 RepID=A0ABT5WRA5_9SPHN|nr:hypothetical protein [Novosphingobium album (ex Liu et al. 2023)]MDE8652271.1 hypothetical protein [Novosphingobium album (ex Liu et al. 2023)]